eukprot:12334509-Alexandrium_andersonii.AAC.1
MQLAARGFTCPVSAVAAADKDGGDRASLGRAAKPAKFELRLPVLSIPEDVEAGSQFQKWA